MADRFPDIDWWCDRCGAYLNDQVGFDDHHYVWRWNADIRTAFQRTIFMNPMRIIGIIAARSNKARSSLCT